MPRKLKKSQSNPSAPKTSQVFDDALPASLKHTGFSEQPKNAISVHTDSPGQLSPYIIHLSHDEPSVTREVASPKLDALAKSLIVEDEPEAAKTEARDLVLDFQDLVHQFRESDYNVSPQKAPVSESAGSVAEPEQPLEAPQLLSPATLDDVVVDQHVPLAMNEQETAQEVVAVERAPEKTKARRAWRLPTLRFPNIAGPKVRAIAAFVTMSFALVLPLHAIQQVNATKSAQSQITDAGRSAIDNFLRGARALEGDRLDVAGVDFSRASQEFSEAEESLEHLNATIATIANVIPQTDRTYESARGLITAGKELSEAATTLADAGEALQSRESLTATEKLSLLSSYVEDALPHIETASTAIERVDANVVPDEYKTAVEDLKLRVPSLSTSMEEFVQFSETLVTIMGGERKMRYLVVFQNNTELRATGGFPGSFAEMDVLNGQIEQIHIPEGGTYDVQGQLAAFVEAPKPLSLINSRWEFHDANWFPDFPTSAKKMLWFYEQAGGPTVDGVLAINATMMPKLLEITGPIEMPEYGRTIDSENFLFETQKIVEFEYEHYDKNNPEREEDAPKQFIGDLAPKILEHLENADLQTTLAMLDILGEGLTQKDVQVYFENNGLQSNMVELGWSGSVKQTEGDYLMVVNTNLGGGKTDTVIDQNVDVYSEVQPDGSIINTVTIRKEHRGLKSALFEGLNNVDYLRLYVPKGSELMSAEGFEIPDESLFEISETPLSVDEDYALLVTNQRVHQQSKADIWEESGKTVFGGWIQTMPGELEQVTFTYKLPMRLVSQQRDLTLFDIAKNRLGFKDLESHTILIQKQPGVLTRVTNVTLSFPGHKSVVWSSHAGTSVTDNIELENTQDHFVRFLLENEVK